MSFVLDASVVFAWQFPDEDADSVKETIDLMLKNGAIVPVHWCMEIANGFAIAVRRKRMTASYREGALLRMPHLPITTDKQSAIATWYETQSLCDKHEMSAYDAAYLEIAKRLKLGLATLDQKLAKACKSEHVPVLGPLA